MNILKKYLEENIHKEKFIKYDEVGETETKNYKWKNYKDPDSDDIKTDEKGRPIFKRKKVDIKGKENILTWAVLKNGKKQLTSRGIKKD